MTGSIHYCLHNLPHLRCLQPLVWVIVVLVGVLSGAGEARASEFPLSDNDLTTHYIIAFDRFVGRYRPVYESDMPLQRIESILRKAGFSPDHDYVSVTGYALNFSNPSLENFVMPYRDAEGKPILWRKLPRGGLKSLLPNWPGGEPLMHQGTYGSMQMMAKPYAVMETAQGKPDELSAERTILLMVTDEVINGTDDDYTIEWNAAATSAGADRRGFDRLTGQRGKTLTGFNEDFKFVAAPIGKNGGAKVSLSPDGGYKIAAYEVVASERPSIHAVTDLPSPLPLVRVRGGYRVETPVSSLRPEYRIEYARVYGNEGERLGEATDGKFDFTIPSSALHTGDSLEVRIALRLDDGRYDGTCISPYNPRYAKGMTLRQPVRVREEAKVFGILPLHDAFWWWAPDNVVTAVIIWDIVLVIIILAAVLFSAYMGLKRLATYTPADSDIVITSLGHQRPKACPNPGKETGDRGPTRGKGTKSKATKRK